LILGPVIHEDGFTAIDGGDTFAGHDENAGETQVDALLVITGYSLQVRRHVGLIGFGRLLDLGFVGQGGIVDPPSVLIVDGVRPGSEASQLVSQGSPPGGEG
jgi:hypothetical protein